MFNKFGDDWIEFYIRGMQMESLDILGEKMKNISCITEYGEFKILCVNRTDFGTIHTVARIINMQWN